MEKRETLGFEEQFADHSVSFTPYTLWNTGILPAQTLLKVDSYGLACVPYQFSMRKGILLCALQPDEVVFFQRYRNALAGLALSFQKSGTRAPLKVFGRCQIDTIGRMKDREGLGLFAFSWKPIPPDLVAILGDYHLSMERLRLEYDDLKARVLAINSESAKKLGYNNFALLSQGGVQHKLAIYSLGVGQVGFLLPPKAPELPVGSPFALSLYFQRYRFSVKGQVEEGERLASGVQRMRGSLEFSPELVELVSEYFFSTPRG